MSKAKWSNEDMEVMRENWLKKTASEIGKMMSCPRSESMIRKKAVCMGLAISMPKWSEKDEQEVVKCWNEMHPAMIGERLSSIRGEGAVRSKARALGLPPSNIIEGQQKQLVTPEDLVYMEWLKQRAAEKKRIIDHQNKCGW